jgi:hypothetical protein
MSLSEERLRILKLIENGQVTADEGARLIDALGEEPARERARPNTLTRSLRVRVTDLNTHRHKVNVTIPVSLVEVGLKLGARLAPPVGGAYAEDILKAIKGGASGRIIDVQDIEEGERVEIFVD